MRRVYIETTIPSYLMAWPSSNPIRAADQLQTREWWDNRSEYELYGSQSLFDECAAGDPTAVAARLEAIRDVPILVPKPVMADLIAALLLEVPLPASAITDAIHIATAVVHRMDILLTWNCRHISNPVFRPRIEEICIRHGFVAPRICSPKDLLSEVSHES